MTESQGFVLPAEALGLPVDLGPIVDLPAGRLMSPHHGILVQPCLFGLLRIQLTDLRVEDEFGAPEGHGAIEWILETKCPSLMMDIVAALAQAPDPDAFCESLTERFRTEGRRIKLGFPPIPSGAA